MQNLEEFRNNYHQYLQGTFGQDFEEIRQSDLVKSEELGDLMNYIANNVQIQEVHNELMHLKDKMEEF